MIWPFGIEQFVTGGLRRTGLQLLLKISLGIVQVGQFHHLGSSLANEVHQPLTSGLEPGVYIDRSNDRLEGIGQGRTTESPTGRIFAAAEDDVLSQLETSSLPGQRCSID